MAGYKLLKRKGVDDHVLIDDDDFSDFPISSPATKIRRLDAESPPIAQVEPEPVPVEAPNEERALVLFKPPSQSPSPFSFTLNPHLISEIKNQVPWSKQRESDCDRLLKSAAEREEQDKKNRGMALVPWVPSTSYQFPILHDTNNTESMEAEELGEGEESVEMDVEQQDTSTNSPCDPTFHGGISAAATTTTVPDGFHQWNQQQQQQQQHCLLPQISQNSSTPITWTR